MRRALLDVNVLLALLDAQHAFHERAHAWWATHRKAGWASSPLTENGLLRVMSHPHYGGGDRGFTVARVAAALGQFVAASDHRFWPDAISLRDPARFNPERIHGGRQLTDIYLLGLAVENGGRLATFDQGIALSAVHGAATEHLCVI